MGNRPWLLGAAAAALLLTGWAAPIAGVLIALPAGFVLVAAVAAMTRTSRKRPLSWVTGAAAGVSVAASALVHVHPPPEMHNVAALCSAVETIALAVLLTLVTRHSAPRATALAAPFAVLAVIALPLRVTAGAEPPASPLEQTVLCLVWLVPALAALMAGYYLRLLDQRRAREVTAARQEQRLQIARDLHDFVGHDLNGIVLEAQAAQLTPDQASAALPRVEQAGLSALQSMDHIVHLLRGAASPAHPSTSRHPGDLASLPELIARFNATATPTATLDIEDGLAEQVPPVVGAIAYRVTVESLTNVRRHATSAALVSVTVSSDPSTGPAGRALTVTVDDDGTGPSRPPDQRHGLGLVGLAESVALLDGELHTGPRQPNGWRVRAVLPIRTNAGPP